ncbi:MAG: ATP-binding protein [Planctomycetota bacterium]
MKKIGILLFIQEAGNTMPLGAEPNKPSQDVSPDLGIYYPFDLAGKLCPLLNDGSLLYDIYRSIGMRNMMKNHLKRADWPGRPEPLTSVSGRQQRQQLPILLGTAHGRATLSVDLGDLNAAPALHLAIWAWIGKANPSLRNRLDKACTAAHGQGHYLLPEKLAEIVSAVKKERVPAKVTKQLALGILASAVLQPDPRHECAQIFLSEFPEYRIPFGLQLACEYPESIVQPQTLADLHSTESPDPADNPAAEGTGAAPEPCEPRQTVLPHPETGPSRQRLPEPIYSVFSQLLDSYVQASQSLAQLADDRCLSDKEAEQHFSVLKDRRKLRRKLRDQVAKALQSRRAKIERLANDYPFKLSAKGATDGLKTPALSASDEEWTQFGELLEQLDAARNAEYSRIARYREAMTEYSNELSMAEGIEGISPLATVQDERAVPWDERYSRLAAETQRIQKVTKDIKTRRSAVQREKKRLEEIVGCVNGASLDDLLYGELSLEDLTLLFRQAKGEAKHRAWFTGVALFTMLEESWLVGAHRIRSFLMNHQDDPAFCCSVVQCLPQDQVSNLFGDEQLARILTYLIFWGAFNTPHFRILDYYHDQLKTSHLGAIGVLAEEILLARNQGLLTTPAQIRRGLAGDGVDDGETIIRSARAALFNFADTAPGMSGMHHELRATAWNLYFRDLRQAIQQDNYDLIRYRLDHLEQEWGEIWHEIFRKTVINSARKRRLESRHEKSARRYVSEGREVISALLTARQASSRTLSDIPDTLRTALRQVCGDTAAPLGSMQWLGGKVATLLRGQMRSPNPTDLAAWSAPGHIRLTDSARSSEWIEDTDVLLPRAYALQHTSTTVTVSTVGTDLLCSLFATTGQQANGDELVKYYQSKMTCWDLRVVLQQLKGLQVAISEDLLAHIQLECARREDSFRSALECLRSDTGRLSGPVGDDIREYLDCAEEVWNTGPREDAHEYLDLAAEEMKKHTQRFHPKEKGELSTWLRRAEVAHSDQDNVPRLRRLKQETLQREVPRRRHVIEIQDLVSQSALPEELKATVERALTELNDPAEWPTQRRSEDIRDAADVILRCVADLHVYRNTMSAGNQHALDDIDFFFLNILPNALREACHSGGEHSLLDRLFAEVNFKEVGKNPIMFRKALVPFGLNTTPDAAPPPAPTTAAEDERVPGVAVFHGWQILRELIDSEETIRPDEPPPSALALLMADNQAGCVAAAVLEYRAHLVNGAADSDDALDVLAIYAISGLLGEREFAKSDQLAMMQCIGSRMSRFSRRIELRNDLAQRLCFGVLRGMCDTIGDSSTWKDLDKRPKEDSARLFLSKLLGGREGTIWFEALWARGKVGDLPEIRPAILHLLAVDEHWRMLETAIELAAPKELQTPLVNFVRLLRARPTSERDANLAMLASHIEQLTKKLPKTVAFRIWVEFIRAHLDQAHAGKPLEHVVLPSGELERADASAWVLRMQITPRQIDYPTTLSLELSEACGLTFASGAADKAKRKIELSVSANPPFDYDLRLAVPRSLSKSGEQIEIGMLFTGTTITGTPFSQLDEQTVSVGAETGFEQPAPSLIEDQYPGAGGNPVYTEGFAGRDKELRRLDQLLQSGSGIWITGMRRIGKTSLLLKTLRPYGHYVNRPVAVIYFALESFNYRKDSPKDYQQQLWAKIRNSILTHERNDELMQYLIDTGNVRSDIEQRLGSLGKDEGDLSTWLPQLADAFAELSGNRLIRCAIMIDEVERLEADWRRGNDEAVRWLMGSLRNVVQQSKKVCLLMAGSDLANRFVDQYEQPFFGSIDRLRLGGFDGGQKEGRTAARDVLLPVPMRSYYQLDEAELSYAIDACAGVPYFLAMLGKTIAATASRKRISKPVIDKAVRAMMHGDEDRYTPFPIDRFLKSLEDLQILGQYEKVRAELFMMCLARITTTEFPEEKEDAVIRQATLICQDISEDEWRQARNHCVKDAKFLVRMGVRLRYRIPVMAEAMRVLYDESAFDYAERLVDMRASGTSES